VAQVFAAQRIKVNLEVRVSWEEAPRQVISFRGVTESLAKTNVLVCLEVLPKVGNDVNISLIDNGRTVVETTARVIRVVRDPSKPLAALEIEDDLEKWENLALPIAVNWLEEDKKLNCEDDWAN